MQRAAWRRSFWSAEHIARFGGAFARLHHDTAEMQGAPLVLGLVMDYRAAQIAPFLLSLRASGFGGQIVLLTANLDEQTHDFLREQEVESITFNPAAFAPYHVQNSRWFHYLQYLLGRRLSRTLPRSIFLTDVRDVLFQADPFASPHAELDVFLENDSPRLGECPVNSRWLRTCFGEHVLAEVASRPIVCSGTTIGSGKGVLAYVIEMWNQMAAFSDLAAREISDQAAHNVIVHRGHAPGLRVNANGGHVLTLHYVRPDEIQITNGGTVIGPGGVISPILHQYDRHPMLKDFVAGRYGAMLARPSAAAD